MRLWLVNPFDPLPGDPEIPEVRYASLARAFACNGHKVLWWTSNFNHRFKRFLDEKRITQVCKNVGIEIQFMDAIAYKKNVSLKRVLNHYLLAKNFSKMSRKLPLRPDVIIASTPPLMLAQEAAKYAKENYVKLIVDTQDIWPEVFYPIFPKFLRPFASLLLRPWHTASKKAYQLADAYTCTAEEYLNHSQQLGGKKKPFAVIPLGVDYQLFNNAASAGICAEFKKPKGEIWFIYAGSITRNHDFLTPIHAFAEVYKSLKAPSKLFIVGAGYLSDLVKDAIGRYNTTKIMQTGFLSMEKLAYLLTQCDIGFNASWPETRIFLPYRLFHYFAGGLAVLNTMPGECSQILKQNNCGLDYEAGNVDDCSRAINEVVSDLSRLRIMQVNSRNLAINAYEQKVLYQQYVKFIEDLICT